MTMRLVGRSMLSHSDVDGTDPAACARHLRSRQSRQRVAVDPVGRPVVEGAWRRASGRTRSTGCSSRAPSTRAGSSRARRRSPRAGTAGRRRCRGRAARARRRGPRARCPPGPSTSRSCGTTAPCRRPRPPARPRGRMPWGRRRRGRGPSRTGSGVAVAASGSLLVGGERPHEADEVGDVGGRGLADLEVAHAAHPRSRRRSPSPALGCVRGWRALWVLRDVGWGRS